MFLKWDHLDHCVTSESFERELTGVARPGTRGVANRDALGWSARVSRELPRKFEVECASKRSNVLSNARGRRKPSVKSANGKDGRRYAVLRATSNQLEKLLRDNKANAILRNVAR